MLSPSRRSARELISRADTSKSYQNVGELVLTLLRQTAVKRNYERPGKRVESARTNADFSLVGKTNAQSDLRHDVEICIHIDYIKDTNILSVIRTTMSISLHFPFSLFP